MYRVALSTIGELNPVFLVGSQASFRLTHSALRPFPHEGRARIVYRLARASRAHERRVGDCATGGHAGQGCNSKCHHPENRRVNLHGKSPDNASDQKERE